MLVIANAIPARYSSDCPAAERLRNEPVRVGKGSVEAGAGVVFLRQREEEFARPHRTRIDRKVRNFFVKQLGAQPCCIGAHQTRSLSYIHVLSASSCSSDARISRPAETPPGANE